MLQTEIESNAIYMSFTIDHPQDHAKEEFKRRYGREPEQVTIYKGALYVGPVVQLQIVDHVQLTAAGANGL